MPEHPALAEVADALNQIGAWDQVIDRKYRLVYITDDFRFANGAYVEMVAVLLCAYIYAAVPPRMKNRIGNAQVA